MPTALPRRKTTGTKREDLATKMAKGRAAMEAKASKSVRSLPVEPGEQFVPHTLPDYLTSNNLWRQASWKSVYNKRLVSGPEELWEKACEYFAWVEANPLHEGKVFSGRDGLQHTVVPKMRSMTNEGLCVFLGISLDTWWLWGKKDAYPDLFDVVHLIRGIIREQKFTGAAADLLNASIIARDLGLAERQEVSGPDGGPLEVLSAREILIDRLSKLRGVLLEQAPTSSDPLEINPPTVTGSGSAKTK